MLNLIISPHSDDAIFSLGAFISHNPKGMIIVSPLMGIPKDKEGRAKHQLLAVEHAKACELLGVQHHLDGSFLDDVYGADRDKVKKYLKAIVNLYHNTADDVSVYIPIGIKHPDHIMISDIMLELMDELAITEYYLYAELPYATRYRVLLLKQLLAFIPKVNISYNTKSNDVKLKAVMAYRSQVDDEVIEDVMVEECIYKVTNDKRSLANIQ